MVEALFHQLEMLNWRRRGKGEKGEKLKLFKTVACDVLVDVFRWGVAPVEVHAAVVSLGD